MGHELASLFINVVGVDQNFANIRSEIVTDGANDQAGLLINQVGTLSSFACFLNGPP